MNIIPLSAIATITSYPHKKYKKTKKALSHCCQKKGKGKLGTKKKRHEGTDMPKINEDEGGASYHKKELIYSVRRNGLTEHRIDNVRSLFFISQTCYLC